MLERLHGLARFAYLASIALAVIPLGSPTPLPLFISALFASVVALPALVSAPRNREAARLFHGCFVIGLVLTAYVLLQVRGLPDHAFAHPIWTDASRLLGLDLGAVSVEPAVSLHALITLVAPLLAFMAGLVLFQSDDHALMLWRALAIGGAAFAVYGLIQLAYFPDTLLIYDRKGGTSSLGGTFVNRNTAGTLLGVASLLQFGLVVRRGVRLSNALSPATIALVAMLGITLVALFLTRSRGAVGSTLAAYFMVTAILLGGSGDRHARALYHFGDISTSSVFRKSLAVLCGLAAVATVFFVFAGRTILRFEALGGDDGRFCILPGIWRAFLDNWLFGTGFGTFQSIFPMYRDPECGIYGAWIRAHNFFLEGLVGLGIVFVPIVLIGYAILIRALWKGYRTRRSMRFVPVIGGGVLVLLTLHSLVDFSLQIHGMAMFAVATLAAILSLSLRRTGTGARSKHGSRPDHDVRLPDTEPWSTGRTVPRWKF